MKFFKYFFMVDLQKITSSCSKVFALKAKFLPRMNNKLDEEIFFFSWSEQIDNKFIIYILSVSFQFLFLSVAIGKFNKRQVVKGIGRIDEQCNGGISISGVLLRFKEIKAPWL